jgi:hypothetical protein
MPVTTVVVPVDEPMVASEGALLLHVPPGVALLNVVAYPTQTRGEPRIGDGDVFTVTLVILPHPVDSEYVTEEIPADTPVTTPVEDTVNIEDPVDQVPPAGVDVSVVVAPWQTRTVPIIADGNGSTVTTAVDIQPVPGSE